MQLQQKGTKAEERHNIQLLLSCDICRHIYIILVDADSGSSGIRARRRFFFIWSQVNLAKGVTREGHTSWVMDLNHRISYLEWLWLPKLDEQPFTHLLEKYTTNFREIVDISMFFFFFFMVYSLTMVRILLKWNILEWKWSPPPLEKLNLHG